MLSKPTLTCRKPTTLLFTIVLYHNKDSGMLKWASLTSLNTFSPKNIACKNNYAHKSCSTPFCNHFIWHGLPPFAKSKFLSLYLLPFWKVLSRSLKLINVCDKSYGLSSKTVFQNRVVMKFSTLLSQHFHFL